MFVVQMTLPMSSSNQAVGRYIGCQGPLPQTVVDFWHMVWEQDVRLVLMLTAETEGRRVKCHRYIITSAIVCISEFRDY